MADGGGVDLTRGPAGNSRDSVNAELVYHRLDTIEALLKEMRTDHRNTLERLDQRLEGHAKRLRPLEDEVREISNLRRCSEDYEDRISTLEERNTELKTTVRVIGWIVAPLLSLLVGIGVRIFSS